MKNWSDDDWLDALERGVWSGELWVGLGLVGVGVVAFLALLMWWFG